MEHLLWALIPNMNAMGELLASTWFHAATSAASETALLGERTVSVIMAATVARNKCVYKLPLGTHTRMLCKKKSQEGEREEDPVAGCLSY